MKAWQTRNEVKGRSAIVTRAENGLGLAIAHRFVAGGARVMLVDQDPLVLERIGREESPPAPLSPW